MTAPLPAASPIGGPFWTWIVPPVLFGLALLATWGLYRRFSRQPAGDDGDRN